MARTTVHTNFKKNNLESPLEESHILEWQKKETNRRLKEMQKRPAYAISWTDGMKKIKLNSKQHS